MYLLINNLKKATLLEFPFQLETVKMKLALFSATPKCPDLSEHSRVCVCVCVCVCVRMHAYMCVSDVMLLEQRQMRKFLCFPVGCPVVCVAH